MEWELERNWERQAILSQWIRNARWLRRHITKIYEREQRQEYERDLTEQQHEANLRAAGIEL